MKDFEWFTKRVGQEVQFKRTPDSAPEVSGCIKITTPRQAEYMYNELQFKYRYEFN